jgi:hypothetical protein
MNLLINLILLLNLCYSTMGNQWVTKDMQFAAIDMPLEASGLWSGMTPYSITHPYDGTNELTLDVRAMYTW